MKRNLLLILVMILLCGQLLAATPTVINYQGRLTNAGGIPVPDGSYSVVFTIHDAASGGTGKWTETQSVTTSSGLFAVLLGTISPITDSVFSSTTRYLGVKVGADPELTPRTPLVIVPYAYRVATIDGANGGNIAGAVLISGVEEGLILQGPKTASANLAYVSFVDSTGSPVGYVGDGSGTDQDIYLGCYSGDVNLYTAGGPALTASTSGSVGVGTSTPYSARRLDVFASGVVQTAVFARSTSVAGNGVVGFSEGQFGYGVWGTATGASSQAGHFSGDVQVLGTLTKSAGSFKIDHPLDPANKYLNHSFVESPDMKNIYDGIVTLDANGEASVQLPEWFGALNRDFCYQLTCVGGYAPVYVSEGISENRFRIAGGTPNLSVSWQVTGIRQDAYANAHRIPVEEMKPDNERGFYAAPEELGHAAEKQVDWARRPEFMKHLRRALQIQGGNR